MSTRPEDKEYRRDESIHQASEAGFYEARNRKKPTPATSQVEDPTRQALIELERLIGFKPPAKGTLKPLTDNEANSSDTPKEEGK